MFIKSPLNYVGGKFKLLPQILPLFPKDIDTFIDVFGGGGNVCINVKSNYIIYNDILYQVVDFLKCCYNTELNILLNELENIVDKYKLSKLNEEGYKQLRNEYNGGNKTPMMFYALVCHSFNNQIRFNNSGDFNLPFGRRSSLNPELKHKFIEFVDHIKTKKIEFFNCDYLKLFDVIKLNKNMFVYLDPPYLVSTATYNEKNGWNEKDEKNLLNFLDEINNRKIKFALSNVFVNKGNENKLLIEWSKKYNVNDINHSYKNCNHQRTKIGETKEVLITNYETKSDSFII